MSKLVFFFLIFSLLLPEIVFSLSLGVSPSSLNMTGKDYADIRVFNSNFKGIRVSFSSSYYEVLSDDSVRTSIYIPARSSVIVHVKKTACKDDALLIRLISSSNIAPSIKVKLICQNKKLNNSIELKQVKLNKKPDPFIGIIIVLSIVALTVIIKSRF